MKFGHLRPAAAADREDAGFRGSTGVHGLPGRQRDSVPRAAGRHSVFAGHPQASDEVEPSVFLGTHSRLEGRLLHRPGSRGRRLVQPQDPIQSGI